jgi:hypothetical protein
MPGRSGDRRSGVADWLSDRLGTLLERLACLPTTEHDTLVLRGILCCCVIVRLLDLEMSPNSLWSSEAPKTLGCKTYGDIKTGDFLTA